MLSPVKLKQGGASSSSSKVKTPAPINWVPKVHAATDFLGFCNGLDILVQAGREGMRAPEFKPTRSSQQKGFFENVNSWVETFKNTEETLDKDKRQLKETAEDDQDDMMSKLNETQSVAQTNKKSVVAGLGKKNMLEASVMVDGRHRADSGQFGNRNSAGEHSDWEKEVFKFVEKSRNLVAKDYDMGRSPFREKDADTARKPTDSRLQYLEVGFGVCRSPWRCVGGRPRLISGDARPPKVRGKARSVCKVATHFGIGGVAADVKDLAHVQSRVQSFLANPVSNERLVPRVIEETEEDNEEGTKEVQQTFLGVSMQPQMNNRRGELALVDFQGKTEGGASPRRSEQRSLASAAQKKGFSPRVMATEDAKGEAKKKGETGRTNASTALPATGRFPQHDKK